MRRLLFLPVVLLAASLGAQSVINPGMTRAEVVTALGNPLAERTSGAQTFLFYKNGVEKRVGMNDLVILEAGKVVDAVFRAPSRKYSGKSSSPVAVTADAARAEGRKAQATSESGASPAPAAKKVVVPEKKAPKLPAEEAQQAEVAKPMPPAARKDTPAAPAPVDPKAAPAPKVAPDSKAPPAKKP
ncbi:MAG: hypothetical protein NTZ43_06030 [Gemmatimonadetes bacterium]|nr:hypothetical protein [Gemmatimonadota bacterium]